MYFGPPPQVLETSVFSEVPDDIRHAMPKVKSGKLHCFLEGPSFDLAGNLYVVDIPYGRVLRVSPEKKWDVVAEYDGEPNGLKIHRDGRLFITDRKMGLITVNPANGEVTPVLAGPSAKERFKGVNDLIFAANGDIYFTDQGRTGLQDPTGRVYRYDMRADKLQCLIDNVPSPNGLVFNVRETALFVAVTRANCLWRIPLKAAPGAGGEWEPRQIDAVSLFVQLFSSGPDGLAVDEEGNVVVTHPTVGKVWLFSKYGVPLYQINSCKSDMTTNVAYGGPGRKTLYIVESRSCSILTVDLPVPGKKMFSHT